MFRDPHDWLERVRTLTLQLVGHASVNGTAGEATFSSFLAGLLRQEPYFVRNPTHLWVEPIAGDPVGRSNVFVLVRGDSERTVLLTGHFDVVSAENYGELAPWAFDPEALLPRLVKHLERNAQSAPDKRALDDLRSGRFLPGRGILDMKSGLAAGLAVLLRYSRSPERAGNLLFIASPDEENRSAGIRSVVSHLATVMKKWNLEVAAAINLDATGDDGDGTDGQAIYLGSVGKLLLSVLLIGRDTHAGYPFDGVNSALFAAGVIQRLECNAGFADLAEGEKAPPPTVLKLEDLKQQYDVTTPGKTWCCINILTHRMPAREVMESACKLVDEALTSALAYLREQAQEWSGHKRLTQFVPRVLTFHQLRALALESGGASATARLKRLETELKEENADLPAASKRLTELLWNASGLTGPAAVVGFASVPYPSVFLSGDEPGMTVRRVLEREAERVSAAYCTGIRFRSFFSGISDMSFLGLVDKNDLQFVADNTPTWSLLGFDQEAIPGLPVVNIGPWGRDYHQSTERVNVAYSFEVLPELVWRVVNGLFLEKR